jgi:integrase
VQAACRLHEEAEFNRPPPWHGHTGAQLMASIKQYDNPAGPPRFVVNYQHQGTAAGRRRTFKTLDTAAAFFYEIEASALGWRTIEATEARKTWTMQKLVWFFLGYQVTKLRNSAIRVTTFEKYRYELLSISGDILNRQITQVSTQDIQRAHSIAAVNLLRSAFSLLIKMKLLDVNPVVNRKKYPCKPISLPGKNAVNNLLSNYPTRERVAAYLGGVCALRIGEALALTYEDVTEKYLDISKHTTRHGVVSGLKRGAQRRIPMPRALWKLLDLDKLGSKKPLLAHAVTGNTLTYAYVRNSPLSVAMKEQGVKRFHDLRHYAVSRLAEKGYDIVRVSRMIGHAKTSITMDRYGHLFGDILEMDLD